MTKSGKASLAALKAPRPVPITNQTIDENPKYSADVPDGVPEKFSEYVKLMFDMMYLAFQTDSTRVASFMINGDGSYIHFPEIGINDGHHNLTHHGGKADWIEKVVTAAANGVSSMR